MPHPSLLNTSWTLHRLSPLHHGKESASLLDNPVALKSYATRLRDQLTGSSTFGGFAATANRDDESLSRTGALKDCVWEILPTLSLLDDHHPEHPSGDAPPAGIAITLEYDNITYKAALLAPIAGASSGSGSPSRKAKGKQRQRSGNEDSASTHLPLLLTRFPNPLRQTFLAFLSANFDTYVSPMRLSSGFLCEALEIYVRVLNGEQGLDLGDDSNSRLLVDLVKELQLTMAFSSSVAPALRSLNVNVPRASLGSMLVRSNSGSEGSGSGFVLQRLSEYIRKHLAMDLDLAGDSENSPLVKQHVRVSKIACAGFSIAGEGRLKLVSLAQSQSRPRSRARAEDGERDEEDEQRSGDEVSQKRRLGLSANEALLRAVIRRASATGENQASHA